MRVLMTGPSSFTGMYVVEALVAAGHQVVVTSTQSLSSYTGVSRKRIERVAGLVERLHQGVCFGDDRFIDLIAQESFDVYCHHGAWTENYRSMDYDIQRAFANNTRSVKRVCDLLAKNGCGKLLVSGSIFAEVAHPFSPYGLAKKMTQQTLDFYGVASGLQVSNVVIPNPFGALDNLKLPRYLLTEWAKAGVPTIQTPDYIRDNIPVDLLALGIADWVKRCPSTVGRSVYRPSGYVSTMAEFVRRLQRECRERTGWACDVSFSKQTDFAQPMRLVNDVPLMPLFPSWDEQAFWDRLVGG